MKKIVLLALIAFITFSCQNNRKEVKETKTVQKTKIVQKTKVDDTERIEIIFQEFKALYSELLVFKSKTDFKKFGFGAGGPYNKWLKNVENLKANPDSKLLLKKGVVAGELEQLGFEYVSSKGKETETTIFFNKAFSDAISPIKVEKVETASGNSNYEKIKSEYVLFGKWQISLKVGDQLYGYPIEIYTKNNKYIQVTPEGEFETVILEKKGNKYYQKGNEDGEYYKIDSNKNMTLFDKDGELSSMGYKATKK
jgi:hypothetical protein